MNRDDDVRRAQAIVRAAREMLDAKLRAENERLRALVEECLRYMHNDFEPDNQSAAYYRIRRALEGK